MGCTSSKLDDLPAVALCRERCGFLDEAIRFRYALAEAHVAYIHSLVVVGNSLQSFFGQGVVISSGSPPSPKLNLPPLRKGDQFPTKKVEASIPPSHHLSHSNSGSHLHIHSDSDDESGSLHYSGHSTPLHPIPTQGGHTGYMDADQQRFVSYPGGGGFMQMNYMRNTVTPSVVYEHRPMSPEKVYHMGESSSSSAYYSYPYSNTNSNPYSNMNSNPYPYYGYSNYGAGVGGYYGSSPPPGVYGSMSPVMAPASSSKPPPPPPPPPATSTWDFMNLFDTYDKYYSTYTPSRDSKEVREEEGIPDLEEENYQREVVKQVHGNPRFVEDNGGGKNSKSTVKDEDDDDAEPSLYKTRPGATVENAQMNYEVHVVDKKIVDDGERSEDRGNGAGFKGRASSIDEVVREITIQFMKASESGNEIAKMLEVGKLPYQRKHGASKMLHLSAAPSLSVASSLPSTSKNGEASSSDKASSSEVGFVEDLAMSSGNLSATLQKLYLWEKKLYNEVKSEEKMRVMHERKCRKLKGLNERGAEAHKIDATRTLIRSLSTKIRMAIQVVDKISATINTIRDEELWPQLSELIHGLTRMWKCMLECNHNQYQAIREARSLGSSIGSGKRTIDPESALQTSRELYNWTFRFSSWVTGQKSYVRALNNWLLKCLLYEPEETADGIAPFSPGRIGAPPVFIICNQWSQSLDRISEKEVVESMLVFSSSVLQIWEQDRGRMAANKDVERKGKNFDREEQKITKEIQAMEKKMIPFAGDGNALSVTGNVVYQSDTSSPSLQAGLQRVFETMERFTADSMKMYEELLQRSEEEQANQER